ncbi:MAG: HPF/RaiA family ribosome-associated protein [Acidiferrobacterales bacterium]
MATTDRGFSMTANVQITFRDFSPPLPAEERIRERVDRLARLHPRITSCRVVAEAPHRHRNKGLLYRVRIDLTVPGGALVVNRDSHAHEDFFVAMRDAFNAMEQMLRSFSHRQKDQDPRGAAARPPRQTV